MQSDQHYIFPLSRSIERQNKSNVKFLIGFFFLVIISTQIRWKKWRKNEKGGKDEKGEKAIYFKKQSNLTCVPIIFLSVTSIY